MSDTINPSDTLDQSLLPKEFKGRIYKIIAWGTLAITSVYSILHVIIGDSIMLVFFHMFYMLTAIAILLSLYKKYYDLAEFIVFVFFPLCFLGSCFSLGELYHSEYYIFLTLVGSIFIFEEKRAVTISVLYNLLIFLLIKISYYHYPVSIFEIKQSIFAQYGFNFSNGFFVASFLVYITYSVLSKNRNLYSELTRIQKDQDKIILERTEELKNTYEEINRFTHISAHDLREPLRNIMSFAQLLQRDIAEGEKGNSEEYIDFIKRNVLRIDTITKDVVYYTDIDDRCDRVENIETSEIVQDIYDDYLREGAGFNLSYSNLPRIVMNRNLCYDLFSQLIENAITYSDKEQKIVMIDCEKKETVYQFSIKDNGNGISEEFISSTFVLFKRLHNNPDHKGSGMGLSLCKKIITSYKGRIWVESDVNRGSTFFFTIPIPDVDKNS